MQPAETGLRTPLSRPNTGKLGTPGRLTSHKTAPKQELKVNVKQLIAPIVNKDREKTLFVNECDKPDVHLRSDQLRPVEMMRIQSAKRMQAAKATGINIDDEESKQQETFNFAEMVSIGRPERDSSLRVPLMRELQALRKYKLGTAPATKTGILRNTLEETVKDAAAKTLLADMSASGRPSSRGGATPSLTMRASLSTPQLSTPNRTPTSRSRNRTSAEDREIVVRTAPSVNMNLYHLSDTGKRTVKTASEKARPPPMMHTDSIDSSIITTADEDGLNGITGGGVIGEGLNGPTEPQPVAVMYDPSTVRLPRLEAVPGFGDSNPALDKALGAYRVHSNRAVTAAAALEEASVTEHADLDSLFSKGADSFHAERVESFYRSAETSHLDSLGGVREGEAAGAGDGVEGGGSMDSHSVSSHAASSVRSIKTAPQQVPIKRGLHCTKCFRAAGLWCQACSAAFCSVCWGQVAHHDLRQMSPAKSRHGSPNNNNRSSPGRPQTEKSPDRARSSSQSPAKHTYAKSVLFQSYSNNRPGSSGPDAKYRQTAAARIPLPDTVVTQYDEYPAPPVFLDGRGRVLEDTIHRRPVTSPVLTQEELHRLQMQNHFKKQSQHEQYQAMLALKYKANTSGSPNSPTDKKSLSPGPRAGTGTGGGLTGSGRYNYTKFQVTTGFHYEPPEVVPTPHSKGRVVVRKNRRKNPKLRPSTGAFDVTGNGTLSLGYGGKPRSGAKPLTGISIDATKDISPLDWKTQLFAGNEVQPGSARKAKAAREGNKTPLFLVKPV